MSYLHWVVHFGIISYFSSSLAEHQCSLYFYILVFFELLGAPEYRVHTARSVTDPENFGGGDFKHKTSKIRMSSPKLRAIFRPKSKIQTIFLPKIRWSPKNKNKKKKVFTKIESDFSAEIENSNNFFAQNQVVSKKKKKNKKKRVFT